ncbi:outer membrane lipoprotein-sorting protein [Myxococcota bacterium]|nr:outer membrane lipoprotein-sorting protein [Myxococcota bacterium]MCZ7618237.1 DUF1329 domain-containing protein [Myxococcota bacterium]
MIRSYSCIAVMAAALLLPPVARAQEDAGTGAPPFREGDVITFDQIDKLRQFLPPEFWANRDFFFYEGMKLEIGPTQRDYSPAPAFEQASTQFKGQPRVGPDDSLENYTAGYAFTPEEIDCQNDPQAGTKHMWNFTYRWEGDGTDAKFYYSYWDRGEELPLFFQGTSKSIRMSRRVEPSLLETQDGDLFRGEKRTNTFGIEVDAPFDARGIQVMTYRYKDSDKPLAQTKNDDTWVYVPTLRRVRRISTAQRTDAVSGTDFTFDDLLSFSGIVPQYKWECLGEQQILAPVNSRVKAYPYSEDHNFGPYGLSYADDRWELRKAVKVRMIPKNADHPYHHKDIYLDAQTYLPLYSFAYDQKQELWKIIWHNGRYSGDGFEEYKGWDEVPEPMDLRTVSDTIVNIQTGTGNRIEFWNAIGTPLSSKGKVRRYIDVGRLTKGR